MQFQATDIVILIDLHEMLELGLCMGVTPVNEPSIWMDDKPTREE